MRTEIRIVAGTLRGSKLTCEVHAGLRPTPQMVREAFFSILGNAVPDRPFLDVFAGTGVMGLEALSRGASSALFVERDLPQARAIEAHLKRFKLETQGRVYRTDVYRWIAGWPPPAQPVNIFLSPPFADLHERPETLVECLRKLRTRVADDSLIILQSERGSAVEELEELADWELRRYGRNSLMIWQRDDAPAEAPAEAEPEASDPR